MSENTLSPHVVLVGDVPIHFEPGADQFAGCDDLEVRGPFSSQHEAQEYAMHLDRYVALVVPLKPSDEPDAMYHKPPPAYVGGIKGKGQVVHAVPPRGSIAVCGTEVTIPGGWLGTEPYDAKRIDSTVLKPCQHCIVLLAKEARGEGLTP